MRATYHLQRLACVAALVLGLLLACLAIVAPPARAAARQGSASGDTVTLAMANGTSFQYQGLPSPRLQVTVTLGQAVTINQTATIVVKLENGQSFSSTILVGPSSGTLTYSDTVIASAFYGSNGDPAIGDHTAVAMFTNPATGQTTQSNSVNFTINKLNFTLDCTFKGSITNIFKPSTSVQVALGAENTESNLPLNWNVGSVSIWFSGPMTTAPQTLQPTSDGLVTVTTPSKVGRYNPHCAFSGSTYYNAANTDWTTFPLLISDMSQLGGVQLYSNPTTFVGTQTMELYIVFHAAPGLPTPTGEYNVTMGTNPLYYTNSLTVGPNGDSSVTLKPNPNFKGASQITVHYFGDGYYNDQSYTFPMTNPAIPGGASGSGGGGAKPAQPKATATAHAKATASATATVADGATPAATPASGHAILSATASPLGGNVGWLVAVLVGLIVLGGAIGGVVFWRSRRKAATLVAASGSPTLSPLDDVTLPHRTPDR